MDKPKYINWIIEEKGIQIKDNIPITCFKINYEMNDDVLDDWALHIRRHYIRDEELDEESKLSQLEIEQYLREHVIPQKNEPLGCTARSSDLTEILVSDLIEFILGYKTPRCKQWNRSGKNNSEHGTDVVGYKYASEDCSPTERDELIAAEVKALLSSNKYTPLLDAITDSKLDEHRLARSIIYYRKKLKSMGKNGEAQEIERFLFKPEKDYNIIYLATAINSREITDKIIDLGISGEELVIKHNQRVFYIHGKKLMDLAHEVYERCVK